MYLVMGILAALHETKSSGKDQAVDAAMVDGIASLMTQPHGTFAAGIMFHERGTNITDSGAPFYDAYVCFDGKWVSIGVEEKKFYQEVLRLLGSTRFLPTSGTAIPGLPPRVGSRRKSRHVPATNGARSSKEPKAVSHRCSRSRKRRITPIFRRAPRMWRSMASRNPHRHLGSAAPFLPH